MNKYKAFKEIENIWYHYKSFIILGIIVAIIFVSLLPSFSQSKEMAIRVVLLGNYVEPKQHNQLQQMTTNEVLANSHSNSEIRMEFWPTTEEKLHTHSNNQKKLIAMIASENVDVLIMDSKSFEELAGQGAFLKLDQANATLLKESYLVKFIGQDGRKEQFGIKLDDNPILAKVGYNTKDKVLGIVANSKNHKISSQFVEWLVE